MLLSLATAPRKRQRESIRQSQFQKDQLPQVAGSCRRLLLPAQTSLTRQWLSFATQSPFCSALVFRTLPPVLLHHPHRAGALLLHLHVHSPGPRECTSSSVTLRDLLWTYPARLRWSLQSPIPAWARRQKKSPMYVWPRVRPALPTEDKSEATCSLIISVLYIEKGI